MKFNINAHNEPQELAAIWLGECIEAAGRRISRIAPGMEVKVQGGTLVSFDVPTHKVVACYQLQGGSHEMALINLQTLEPITIQL